MTTGWFKQLSFLQRNSWIILPQATVSRKKKCASLVLLFSLLFLTPLGAAQLWTHCCVLIHLYCMKMLPPKLCLYLTLLQTFQTELINVSVWSLALPSSLCNPAWHLELTFPQSIAWPLFNFLTLYPKMPYLLAIVSLPPWQYLQFLLVQVNLGRHNYIPKVKWGIQSNPA